MRALEPVPPTRDTMRSARTLGFGVMLVALSTRVGAQQAASIAFTIDTVTFTENALPAGPDANRLWSMFGSFTARVRFAAGRGRLDILTRRTGPTIVVDGFASSAPLGTVGDYYLFDSTGYVLVRPRAKTYSVFSIWGDVYNRARSREGWPKAFMFAPSRFDTVGASGFADPGLHGAVGIFWHTDRVPYTSPDAAELARGKLIVEDAPYGELNVVQWFAPARSFAQLVASGGTLPARATLTTAVPEANVKATDDVPTTLILKREFFRLQSEPVDLRELTLPAGYSEVAWSGKASNNGAPPSGGDRWRKPPSRSNGT